MRACVAVAALLLAALAAASASAAPAPGDSRGTIDVDGSQRSYLLHVPALAGPGSVALVVALHGGFGSGAQLARSSGFSDLADREDFVVVYPDGIRRHWNDGRVPGTVDDVHFVGTLIARLAGELPIDPRRVYVVGHSNGAMMAQRLACELAREIAAIGTVAGSMPAPLASSCRPARPVSVIQLHGTADTRVPYGGGPVRAPRGGEVLSAPASAALWRRLDGCRGRARTSEHGGVVRTRWSACRAATAVELVTVRGGGHAWPVAAGGPQLIWRFFERHPAA